MMIKHIPSNASALTTCEAIGVGSTYAMPYCGPSIADPDVCGFQWYRRPISKPVCTLRFRCLRDFFCLISGLGVLEYWTYKKILHDNDMPLTCQ